MKNSKHFNSLIDPVEVEVYERDNSNRNILIVFGLVIVVCLITMYA